jgi:hypothetical protein
MAKFKTKEEQISAVKKAQEAVAKAKEALVAVQEEEVEGE